MCSAPERAKYAPRTCLKPVLLSAREHAESVHAQERVVAGQLCSFNLSLHLR